MKKKAIVTARSFERETGFPSGPKRKEVIDLENNILFRHCKTILEIKSAYESFWNNLNPKSKEVVFVSKVMIKE